MTSSARTEQPTPWTPDVSVIIVTWNSDDFIRDCVASVFDSAGTLHPEVIVIDNNSGDRTVEIIEKEFPQVVLVRNSENRLFAAANNQGKDIARGKFILFLNPDTVMLGDSLAKMVETLQAEPTIGVLGPRLVDEKGKLSRDMGDRTPSARTVINSFFLLSRISPGLFPGVLRTKNIHGLEDCDWVCGACLLVRSELADMTTWKTFGLGDDFDYCLPIREAGWRVSLTGDAEVIHYCGRSFKKARTKALRGTPSRFAAYLGEHCGPIEARVGIAGMRLGMRMRGLVHGAIFIFTRDPEQLYKSNKIRQFLDTDEYSVLRKQKKVPPRAHSG